MNEKVLLGKAKYQFRKYNLRCAVRVGTVDFGLYYVVACKTRHDNRHAVRFKDPEVADEAIAKLVAWAATH